MINIDYLYNPDIAKKSFEKNYFIDKKLGFKIIENGTILPHKMEIEGLPPRRWGYGGIVDSKSEYLRSSFTISTRGGAYTPPPHTQDIRHSSETVIYLGLFVHVWGHAITDNICRLWFLNTKVFKSEFKNCPIVYIPWEDQPLKSQKNFMRLLKILGIDFNCLIPVEQPIQFEKIILPDKSFLSGKAYEFTSEYRSTIDCIRDFALKNRTPTFSKKIYYYYGKHQLGEKQLAEYFKSKGYEIFRTETLTLDEQLNLLINANSFAATLGSISHNSVFLRDEAEAIFIPRAANSFTYHQQVLNQVHPLNTNYIDSVLSIFAVGVPRLNCFIISEQLKKFFGDKWNGYEDDDFKIFLQYVKDSINKGRSFNQNAKNYYSPVLEDFMEQLKKREDLIATYNMPLGWETFKPPIPEGLGYQTHVHKDGWGSGWKKENQISNPLDKKLDIQAIKINFPNHKVYYSVYFDDKEGWSPEVSNNQQAGTTDKSKSIFGISIRFDEAGAKEYDILYRMHKFDDTWTDWAKNGEALYSHGVKLNAIQIKLEPKT